MMIFFFRSFVPKTFSVNASNLFCIWDFNITNERAVKLKQKNLHTQIKVQTTGGTKLMCMSHSFWRLSCAYKFVYAHQVSGRVTQVC